jgi:molecular chaperone GrpE
LAAYLIISGRLLKTYLSMAKKNDTNKEDIKKDSNSNIADNLTDKTDKETGSTMKGPGTSKNSRAKKKSSAKNVSKASAGETDSKVKTEQGLEEKLTEAQEKYLRLSAEFDNYRKRTLKEKMDLTKTAGESIIHKLLPVMDDFDRALQVMEEASDCKAMKEGIDLIYSKFNDFLRGNGVKEIDALRKDFDTDEHEAITKIPAPEKKLKGKVVDVIQKGYYLNDKVMRYAKVVIGE